MKYATKLMVVPYVPRIEVPQESKVLTLDDEIYDIINNKKLSVSDKVQLYNQTLLKYKDNLELYNNNDKIEQKNYIDTISSQFVDKVKKEINHEIKAESIKNEPIEKNEGIENNESIQENDTFFEDTYENNLQTDQELQAEKVVEKPIDKKPIDLGKFRKQGNSYYVGKSKLEFVELNLDVKGKQISYIVPKGWSSEGRLIKLQTDFPNGFNTKELSDYLYEKGVSEIEAYGNIAKATNMKSRNINDKFLEIAEKFKKQTGSGTKLKHLTKSTKKINWLYKKFF